MDGCFGRGPTLAARQSQSSSCVAATCQGELTIIAPPNPLRGLTGGDGEYLESVIGEIDGPVLLVGHSYGGSVITADIPLDDAAFYAISQRPLAGVALTEAAGPPAWRGRPVRAVLGTADRCIDPGVHRFSYERMGAQITEVEGASHVVMISHPEEVAAVVMTAVHACAPQPA